MAIRQITSGRNKGQYVIDWRDEYGIRRYQMVGYHRRAAQDLLHKKLSLRAEKRTLDKNEGSGVRFWTLCDEYLENYAKVRKWSWTTDQGKIRLFKAFFGNPPIESIARRRVNEYALARRNQGIQGGTVNKEIAILKRMFWYAVDSAWLEHNPAQRWQEFPENEPDGSYLEWGQYQALLSSVELLSKHPRSAWRGLHHLQQFRYIIPLAYEAGGRREEIVSMAPADLDLAHARVRFWCRKGKNHELRSRWVPISEHLVRLFAEIPVQGAYLFPDENSKRWRSKIAFYRQWKKIVKEARLSSVKFHRLRHSYCSQLANRGVDESTRMNLMGHTSSVTQQRYTHISEERKRQVTRVFDDLRMREGGDSKAVLPCAETPSDQAASKNASKDRGDLHNFG